MMDDRRGRRWRSNPALLPLRSFTSLLSNTVSCWYCDFKFLILNEPVFHFGRRYSSADRWFRVWFTMGIGFGMAALVGVTAFTGLNISFTSFVCLCASSIVSVLVHEFGHALAAASEGVHIEYIAIFLAVFFPGALVAFNYASLQALPAVASLRIYCAGIWHNAVFCAVCTFMLLFLPYILSPFYTYGEGPMVMDVAQSSPLSSYLSPRDVIVSLDNTLVHTTEEWRRTIMLLTEQSKLETVVGHKGYCVPHSLIQENAHTLGKGNDTTCPNEFTAFVSAPCLDSSVYDDNEPDISLLKRWESIQCLDASDVVKLKKCSYNKMETPINRSGCVCSEVESCLSPVQHPGQQWAEITFSRSDCQNVGNSDATDFISQERSCLQTFVFVGDLISMAHSIHLTSYQPRLYAEFAAHLPNTLERIFMCTFHVSMLLALLNSLPVYFLDGESILEAIIHLKFISLNSSKRRLILRCCLLGGTMISVTLFLQMVLHRVV
ncbi:membrane-bound transcription factor site-2 protease-like [Dorcoceras hygrometricum]|uniref:Endopeptidase S2P n=1 Tax=Dorcoceras hygrometricum TaxID=472368 RepID=A0A2Z7CPJ3_9LAMI|nr:membrane-bound transcription factor site-2 protease-like [Dorcoceras hygrometricum]